VDHYTVEISTLMIPNSRLILKNSASCWNGTAIALALERRLFIQSKAVSSVGLEDSKWSVVTATTLSEQLLVAVVVMFRLSRQHSGGAPNSSVTRIVLTQVISLHVITAQEKKLE
jgi:hypothetical protein